MNDQEKAKALIYASHEILLVSTALCIVPNAHSLSHNPFDC